MPKFYYFAALLLMGLSANAQNYQGLIRVSPDNPTESDLINIEFLSGCRDWNNHQFIINGNQISYSVNYLECLILPPPESFAPYPIGNLVAGDYTLELSIRYNGSNQIDTVVIPFVVGSGSGAPAVAVPLTIHTYLLLTLLMAWLTFLHLRPVRKLG